MAGVSQGPNAFFRITPADQDKALCFAIKRGEIQNYRLNSNYYHPERINALSTLRTASHNLTVSRLVDVARFERNQIKEPGANYLSMSHVQSHTGELTDATDTASGSCFTFQTGDVLFARLGAYLNKVYCAEMNGCCSTEFHVLRVNDPNILLPEYLATALRSRIILAQTIHMASGNTHPRLTNWDVENLLIPILELEVQRQVIQDMSAARAKGKAMLDEADALMTSIDAFVLSALEINPTPPQANVFTTRYAAIKGSRFDPDFHSLRFRTIRNALDSGLHPAKSIGELCEYIRTGFAAGRQDQAFDYETGVPHIRPLNLDVLGQVSLDGTKFVPKTSVSNDKWCVRGEVLFNNTNSTGLVGKSAVFDLKQPCACSNHITRLKPYVGVEPEFLTSMLNALRQLGYLGLLSTNFNNQAGVNIATLSQVRIPVPPLEEQGRIVGEIIERRNKARRMRSEAEVILRDAKQRFEAQLLGGVENC